MLEGKVVVDSRFVSVFSVQHMRPVTSLIMSLNFYELFRDRFLVHEVGFLYYVAKYKYANVEFLLSKSKFSC